MHWCDATNLPILPGYWLFRRRMPCIGCVKHLTELLQYGLIVQCSFEVRGNIKGVVLIVDLGSPLRNSYMGIFYLSYV